MLEHADQPVDLGRGAPAFCKRGRKRLDQHGAQMGGVGGRGEQVGHWLEVRHHLLRFGLELAHALEIAGRVAVVLDGDAEQGRGGGPHHFCKPRHRLDLDHLARLDAVHRGARDSELFRDRRRGESVSEPVGPQAVADVLEGRGHGVVRIRSGDLSACSGRRTGFVRDLTPLLRLV